MKIAGNIAVFLAAVSLNFLRETEADECKDFVNKMMMEQMKFVVPCIVKLGLTTPEAKKEKLYCIMKCVLQDAKMLGADGNVDFDLVTQTLESMPASLKDKAQNIFSECGQHAASLDPAEATCQSYSPLLTCVIEISAKMCG